MEKSWILCSPFTYYKYFNRASSHSMSRQPFVFWAQNEQQLFLTVDLKDATDVDCNVFKNVFEFFAIGNGAQGRCEYSFTLALYSEVEIDKASEEVGVRILYVLRKKEAKWWPTVAEDSNKRSWLRVDFDRFMDPDDSDVEDLEIVKDPSEEEMDELTDRIMKECGTSKGLSDEMRAFKRKCAYALKCYLFTYNLLMFMASLCLFIFLACKVCVNGANYMNSFWLESGHTIKFLTALQIIDIVHAILGFTNGSYLAGMVQVFGRLAVVYMIDSCQIVQTRSSTFILIMTYFTIELIRYPYYALNGIKKESYVLTWLRYNAWILLYPTGLILEGVTIYSASPYYIENSKFNFSMPGPLNFNIHFGFLVVVFLICIFPPAAFYLLKHMWFQRLKKMKVLRKKMT